MRVELAQEPAFDRVARGAADHRVDPALRAQGSLRAVDPGLDVRRGERLEAEEAAADRAVGQLVPVLRGMGVSFDAASGIG